jgi:putative ABC transport system substrate-binding protein
MPDFAASPDPTRPASEREMNRRDFIAGSTSAGLLAGGALGGPCAARAQPQNLPKIGLLDPWGRLGTAVNQGLADNGFIQARHFRFEPLWDAHRASLAEKAAELVKRDVALILAFSGRAAAAAKAVTQTTPIIFLAEAAVATGLVDRTTRAGGNLAGIANPDAMLIAERIEIARELVPAANLVVLATDPSDQPLHDIETRAAQAAAKALGLELSVIAWSGDRGIEPELAALPRDRKAVLVFGGGLPFIQTGAILAYLAVRYEIPAIHGNREAAEEGGLVSFGPRFADGGHLMGAYAARVLKGEKAADLPVGRIARTELVINLWPAKSLGLQMPSTLLARADEVIE